MPRILEGVIPLTFLSLSLLFTIYVVSAFVCSGTSLAPVELDSPKPAKSEPRTILEAEYAVISEAAGEGETDLEDDGFMDIIEESVVSIGSMSALSSSGKDIVQLVCCLGVTSALAWRTYVKWGAVEGYQWLIFGGAAWVRYLSSDSSSSRGD